jgi:ankyrin repeat protein
MKCHSSRTDPFRGICRPLCLLWVSGILSMLLWTSLTMAGEIQTAVKKGDLKMVQALLKENPNLVYSKDTNGCTPLCLAISAGKRKVAEFLLAKGSNVNAQDKSGNTPLILAAYDGAKDLVELLLANEANINATNNGGLTALHFAVYTHHINVVELLLAKDANVNAKDSITGATPLHYAALDDYVDEAKLLLANHADIDAKNSKGETPLKLAVSFDNKGMAEFLRGHGGHE